MRKQSLPVKSSDGAVVIRPLRKPAHRPQLGYRPRRSEEAGQPSGEESRVIRARILRDIAILVLIGVTILAGSGVLLGMLWRDVSIARTEVQIVEAREAARVKIAEAEALVTQTVASDGGTLVLGLVGLGLGLALVCLLRPTIIVGR